MPFYKEILMTQHRGQQPCERSFFSSQSHTRLTKTVVLGKMNANETKEHLFRYSDSEIKAKWRNEQILIKTHHQEMLSEQSVGNCSCEQPQKYANDCVQSAFQHLGMLEPDNVEYSLFGLFYDTKLKLKDQYAHGNVPFAPLPHPARRAGAPLRRLRAVVMLHDTGVDGCNEHGLLKALKCEQVQHPPQQAA